MNMKKFLTVFILGIAAFAVSCSDDSGSTTDPTKVYDVTSAQLNALAAAVETALDDVDVTSVNNATGADSVVTKEVATELGNIVGTYGLTLDEFIDDTESTMTVAFTVDVTSGLSADTTYKATVTLTALTYTDADGDTVGFTMARETITVTFKTKA